MPPQMKKSGLAAKYGNTLSQAVSQAAGEDTTYGVQPVPPGIKNGIAKLVECKFDVYKTGQNEGEYYFRAAGVVVEPKDVLMPDGRMMVVEGLQTSIMEAVCDTKTQDGKVTTQAQHISKILNEMRKLGADTNGVGAEHLEDLAEALKTAQPYFKFTTSLRKAQVGADGRPKGEDGVWENWHGTKGLEDYSPDVNPAAHTKDNSNKPVPKAAETPKAAPTTTNSGFPGDDGDILKMVEGANAENPKSQEALMAKAYEVLGWGDAEVSQVNSYDEVGAAILEALESGGSSDPKAGNIYLYAPMVKGPGGKLFKVKKQVECECVMSNPNNQTVNLKNIANGQLYNDVLWGELIVPS